MKKINPQHVLYLFLALIFATLISILPAFSSIRTEENLNFTPDMNYLMQGNTQISLEFKNSSDFFADEEIFAALDFYELKNCTFKIIWHPYLPMLWWRLH